MTAIGPLEKFLAGVIEKNHFEIVIAAKKEHVMSRQRRSSEFHHLISGFLFWLQTGSRPAGICWDHFLLFRPVCEALVRRGELEPRALEEFERPGLPLSKHLSGSGAKP